MTKNEMITKMLKKQDELNIITNGASWKMLNIPWYRAIWTECAEMLDYTPWKWWKHGKLKLDDIKIELVDIWHFGMSDIIARIKTQEEFDECVKIIAEYFDTVQIDEYGLQEAIEQLATKVLANKMFNFVSFVKLCKILNLSIEELYKIYIGKNVLNEFRQDHGYKDGTYVKIWNGKEDNYYMMETLKNLAAEQVELELYNKLKELYNKETR